MLLNAISLSSMTTPEGPAHPTQDGVTVTPYRPLWCVRTFDTRALEPWIPNPALKFSLNSVPLTIQFRPTMNGDTQIGSARVPEMLKGPAEDDRARPIGGRDGAVDPEEAPILTVDDGAGSEVEGGELLAGPDRAGEAVDALREAERRPSRMIVDERLQVVTGTDVDTPT